MTHKKSLIITAVLLTFGVAFIVFGAFSGGAEGVLAKAVKICMECIGIG